jgi:hypothetical protein
MFKMARIGTITPGSSAGGPVRSLPNDGDASRMTALIPMTATAAAA